MAFRLKSLFRRAGAAGERSELVHREGALPVTEDTSAAIEELSRAIRNNPDAVEIYLALGNLFRAKGEIERAVHIRNSLIIRPNLNRRFKGRAYFELGRDYRRGGFIDRAQSAFESARCILGDDPAILEEMMRLLAESQEFEAAARYASLLNNIRAEAHFLVRRAEEAALLNDGSSRRKWLNRALKVYPGSPEAWTESVLDALSSGNEKRLCDTFTQAMQNVRPEMAFVLYELLLEKTQGATASFRGSGGIAWNASACSQLLPLLEEHAQDILALYYGAWFCLHCGDRETALRWLEKTILLDESFWPARLELLALSLEAQAADPAFRVQLEFFLDRARGVKRFVCKQCGLKREQVFFVCPRCHAWHSITFRMTLSD